MSGTVLGVLHRWPHLIHLPSSIYPKVLNYQCFSPSPPPPTTQPLSPLIHSWVLTGLLIGSLFSLQQTGPSLHISFHHQLPLLLKACPWFPIAVGLKCIRPTKSGKIWPHLPSASHPLPCSPHSSYSDLLSIPKTYPASSCHRGFAVSSA